MSYRNARRTVVLLAVLAILGAFGWWLFPSDARRVRARFHALATLVSVPATEQDLARLARARSFGAMLATDIAVTFDEGAPPLNGREAFVLLVARPAGVEGGIKVELADVTVQVGPGGEEATSAARARLLFTDPQTKLLSAEERDVNLEWRKTNGNWLVAAARVGVPLSSSSVPVNAR